MNKIGLSDIERELDYQENLVSPEKSLEYNNRIYKSIFQRYLKSVSEKIHYKNLLEIISDSAKRICDKLNKTEEQR